jgi:hypothetical protein
MPGMQISLLPEYVRASSSEDGWNNWSVTVKPTVKYGVAKVSALSSFEAPATPAAADDIKYGAYQVAAATIVALASISATIY